MALIPRMMIAPGGWSEGGWSRCRRPAVREDVVLDRCGDNGVGGQAFAMIAPWSSASVWSPWGSSISHEPEPFTRPSAGRMHNNPMTKCASSKPVGWSSGCWTALGGHGAPGIELAHNVRSPEEVTEVLKEAEHAGGSIVRHAAVADWGGTTGAFSDPDGYVWEVAHNPGWTLDPGGAVHI